MKKMLTALLSLMLMLSMVGCGKKDGFGAAMKTYFFHLHGQQRVCMQRV